MRIASQFLIGEHDFRNMCKMDVGNGVVQFTRRIIDIQIDAIDGSDGSYSLFKLKLIGQAFLWVNISKNDITNVKLYTKVSFY